MAAKHAGVKEFTGDETANLFLGQGGFHLLGGASEEYHTIGANETITTDGTSRAHTGKNDGTYWCAIKAINGAAVCCARSYNESDDFAQSGTYADSSGQIAVADGDIIYGAFDAITVTAGDYIVAYIGK